jgi:GNAT superfamily N-acetyltransferase
VRHCARVDLAAVTEIFTAGFIDDPWFRWLWPADEDYAAHAPQWFALVSDAAFTKGHSFITRDATAAALWTPPDVALASDAEMASAAALLQRQLGDRASEAFDALGASAGSAPAVPHFACVYVAAKPRSRGRGIATALMQRTLQTCDTDGFGAHLVSTNERNLSFYRRLGFELTDEVSVARGAVTFRPMWRGPSTLG